MSRIHSKWNGSGQIRATLGSTLGLDFEVHEIRLHLTTGAATGAESFTATIQSSGATSGPHNCVIASQLMTSVQDYVFRPSQPVHLKHNDKLLCAWLNDASSYKQWGLEILWCDY